MPKLRLCSAALLLPLVAASCQAAQAPAQTPAQPAAQASSPIDQKTLLATARHAYYLPLERNVLGFSCSVAIDWQPLLERATGKRLSSKDATLTQLSAAKVTLTDDILKGASVTSTFPDAKFQPLPGSSADTKQNILNRMIQAAFAGWNPFLSDRILPMEATRYHFERVGSGYRLTLDGGAFFSILDLSPDLRITHGESHLNGTVTDFTPQFDPSSHGWLLTSLATSTDTAPQPEQPAAGTSSSSTSAPASSGSASKTSFTYSYQFVGDMLIPKRVLVQVGDGPETPFELQNCTLVGVAHDSTPTAQSTAPTHP